MLVQPGLGLTFLTLPEPSLPQTPPGCSLVMVGPWSPFLALDQAEQRGPVLSQVFGEAALGTHLVTC